MESNSVSPMPEMAPMAEFDKSPPSPPETPPLTTAMDDLPPPPNSATIPMSEGTQSANTNPEKSQEKHRHYEDDNEWACTNWFEYMLVVVLASLLLLGSVVVTLFWVLYYREGFAWTEKPHIQFNLHPVLMIAGFITFSGFSILLYRVCRCCRRIYVKLFHTIFHALAIPCIVVGFIAVLDSHNLANPPIPNFYSLHSWMGLVTMGLFALQFVVGFFSFLILLCCEGATAAFRASLVPIHATFGITTFMLAIATCLTGLTEKALFTLKSTYGSLPEEAVIINVLSMVLVGSAIVVGYIVLREDFNDYSSMPEEGIVMNALAMVLVALGILLSYAVRRESFRSEVKTFVTERL